MADVGAAAGVLSLLTGLHSSKVIIMKLDQILELLGWEEKLLEGEEFMKNIIELIPWPNFYEEELALLEPYLKDLSLEDIPFIKDLPFTPDYFKALYDNYKILLKILEKTEKLDKLKKMEEESGLDKLLKKSSDWFEEPIYENIKALEQEKPKGILDTLQSIDERLADIENELKGIKAGEVDTGEPEKEYPMKPSLDYPKDYSIRDTEDGVLKKVCELVQDSIAEYMKEMARRQGLLLDLSKSSGRGDAYVDITSMEHTGAGVAIGPAETIIMNAVLGALPGVISTAFENNVPSALENAVQSVISKKAEETGIGTLATGEESQNLSLNIEEMKNMLVQMASQSGDEGLADVIATKILEKTGGVVGGEGQMTREEMIATIGEGMEELPEQHKEILGIVERNQTLIYSYQDQLLRLEHMIQTKALTIDQIYKKIVKKMWDEYRCGG